MLENSREIEKMFYQDVANKKRIGSNAYRRTGKGSDRAGVAGGVRFAKNNFKRYEKNSRVKIVDLNKDIASYNIFKTFDKDKQRRILNNWIHRFTNKEIYTKMGISENRFYRMMNTLNIERGKTIVRADKSSLDALVDDKLDIYRFKTLPDDQKFEVVDRLQKEKRIANADIAEMLGYSTNTFNTLKSQWRKSYEKRVSMNMSEYDDGFLVEGLDGQKNQVESDGESYRGYDKENRHEDMLGGMFEINYVGTNTGEELKEKLDVLIKFLNDDSNYKISLKLENDDV